MYIYMGEMSEILITCIGQSFPNCMRERHTFLR